MSRARLIALMLFWALAAPSCLGPFVADGSTSAGSGEAGTGGGGQGGFGGSSGSSGQGGFGGEAPVTDLYVDPSPGADEQEGTKEAPLQTLQKALSLAASGVVIHLAGGTYDAASGEVFPLVLPDGVRLRGPTTGDAVALLRGTETETGLLFAGKAWVTSKIRLEAFDVAIAMNDNHVSLDDVSLRGNHLGLWVAGASDLHAQDVTIEGGTAGFVALGTSQLTMTGGHLRDIGADCTGESAVGYVQEEAHVGLYTLNVSDSFGELRVSDMSLVYLQHTLFANVGAGACGTGTGASIVMTGASGLVAQDVWMQGGPSFAILAGGAPSIFLYDSRIFAEDGGEGIRVSGGSLFLGWSEVSGGPSGFSQAIGVQDGASLELAFTYVHDALIGVWASNASLTVHDSVIAYNTFGLRIADSPWKVLDLGTPSAPGNNLWDSNTDTAVEATSDVVGEMVINAAGNTWRPGVQGASPLGEMGWGSVMGPQIAPPPRNYALGAGVKLTF